jgi:predicted MFS family arabinose efflux permease
MLALRIRDFRLLWTGQLLSSLGSWLLLIAVPYRVYELTGSPVATGFAFTAGSVPGMTIAPLAGVAADRWNRRRTMLAVTLGQAACVAPLGFVHRAGQVGIVYAALMAESVLGQFYQPAEQALVPGMVGRGDELISANTLMSVNRAVTRIAGASLGGVAFAVLGLPGLVAIDAGSYVASAVCILLLRWRAAPSASGGRPRRLLRRAAAELGRGARHVTASRPLCALLTAAAVFSAGNGAFTALLVPYTRLRLHGGAADVGLLVAATGAGYLGRALFRRLGLRPLTATSLLVTAAAFAAWFSAGSLGLALVLAALTGMSAMVFLIARLTCLQQSTPDAVLGRTCSLFLGVEAAAGLAGTAIGSVLVEPAGFAVVADAAALTIAAGAAVCTVFLRAASSATTLPAEGPR